MGHLVANAPGGGTRLWRGHGLRWPRAQIKDRDALGNLVFTAAEGIPNTYSEFVLSFLYFSGSQ